jgi:hypothetical protein
LFLYFLHCLYFGRILGKRYVLILSGGSAMRIHKVGIFTIVFSLFLSFFPQMSFADQDFTPPVLESLELILPDKPVLDVGDTIVIKGKFIDDNSGLDRFEMSFMAPNSNGIYLEVLDPNIDGSFEIQYTLKNSSRRGNWRLNQIISTDKVGNRSSLGGDELGKRFNLNRLSFNFGYKGIAYNSTYFHDITPVFNGDGKLNGNEFISGTAISENGSYTLVITEPNGEHTTVPFKVAIVKDNVKPVILGASDKTININSTFDSKNGVTANDNVDGNLTSVIKITGTINTTKKGTYTLTYSVKDKSENVITVKRKITVIDNVKPVISGATYKTIKLKSKFNSKTGVTAKDNVDGDIIRFIKITGTVNTTKKGTYTLNYTVTDKSGNKAVVTRKITVK